MASSGRLVVGGLGAPGDPVGARVVGISSGASAPEDLVQRLVAFFRARGTEQIEEFEVVQEDVRFMLPKTIRQALAAQSA